MMKKHSRVAEALGIEYPVIQAPMSWITSAELAAAVSNAGGLGILGPNAGQTELTTDPIETAERMRAEIRKTRSLTKTLLASSSYAPATRMWREFLTNLYCRYTKKKTSM